MILTLLRALFILALLFSLLPLGSVRAANLYFSSAVHGLLFAALLLRRPPPAFSSLILGPLLIGVSGTVAYLVLQSAWLEGHPLASPVWAAVAADLGLSGGAVSVSPGATIQSIPSLLTPFLVFGTAALLSSDDTQGLRTWRSLAAIGIVLALFGLLRFYLFPDLRLFSQDHLSQGVVTSVLVNRNNAATLFGLTALATLGLFFWQLARTDRHLVLRDIRRPSPAGLKRHWPLLLTLLALCATLVALFLTRSRGGVLISVLALSGALLLIIYKLSWRELTSQRKWTAMGIVGLVAIVGFGAFGQLTIMRAEIAGYDESRDCLYRDVTTAIGDYPLLGTGFGTFEDVYPTYRQADCGIYGVPEKAHNAYLEAYLGLGLPFALLLVAGLLVLYRIYTTGIRQRRRLRFIPIVSLAALALMLGHSAVDFSIQIHGVAVYFAALLGAGAGVSLARSGGQGRA